MNGKMAAIFGVLIIGLAVMAASYAYWTETLSVSGSVTTGELDAQFTNAFTDDDGGVNNTAKDAGDDGKDPKECGPNPARYGYDVAASSANITDPHTAMITVSNSYPSYYTTAWFDIQNTGTIPVKIKSVNLEGVPTELNVTKVADPTGTILEPGETAQLGICVHVKPDAGEGATYTFSVTVDVEQFNAPQQT